MGWDVEVYVDDIVIKLITIREHCSTLQRLFDVLKKYQLKLNPEKCSFKVQVEKFLMFMLTKREIEVNLNKCQAIIDTRSPKNIKELQQLAGKIMTLACFLSRLVETTLAIFHCLRKSDKFLLTEESEDINHKNIKSQLPERLATSQSKLLMLSLEDIIALPFLNHTTSCIFIL
ncbi:Retrovirus-related Pol polyprotein from transposon 17.6, partial [Mucuna pruriens]